MNKMKIVFGIGIILAALAALTAPAVADYNIFHLIPEESSCEGVGCTTTVWVKVNTSYNDINALQASIIFDPSMVNVTNVVEGTDPDWYMWDWHIFTSGGYTYVKISPSDVLGAYGPGVLEIGKMTLQCEAPGVSALHFADESEVKGDRTEINHPAGIICGPAGSECPMEDGTFTCVGPEETFNKPLVAGWNLISLPLTATDMTVANILDASLSGNYDALHKYDTATHNFVPLSSTDTMANGAGYFIHITSPDTWTYSGSAYTTMNEDLSEGLNMVGWLNCSKDIVSNNALSSLAGSYYYAARWNVTSQRYETYNPAAPGEFNDFTMMERGEGYFISAEADCPALTKNC